MFMTNDERAHRCAMSHFWQRLLVTNMKSKKIWYNPSELRKHFVPDTMGNVTSQYDVFLEAINHFHRMHEDGELSAFTIDVKGIAHIEPYFLKDSFSIHDQSEVFRQKIEVEKTMFIIGDQNLREHFSDLMHHMAILENDYNHRFAMASPYFVRECFTYKEIKDDYTCIGWMDIDNPTLIYKDKQTWEDMANVFILPCPAVKVKEPDFNKVKEFLHDRSQNQ